jgi:hypothetical protein
LGVKSKGWKLLQILVFSMPINRENLQPFLHELHNKVHRFVSFSMEISEKKNDVTFVTDGHLLSVIIIVAKLPG